MSKKATTAVVMLVEAEVELLLQGYLTITMNPYLSSQVVAVDQALITKAMML